MAEFSKTAKAIEEYLADPENENVESSAKVLLKKAAVALEEIALGANKLADQVFYSDKEISRLQDRVTYLEETLTETSHEG